MTRKQILALLIMLLSIILYIALFRIVAGALASESQVQSCSTPAANFATLTSCRTQTAQATRGTSVPTITRTPQPTPTRLTPLPTFIANPVFVRIRVNGADLGIILLEPGKPINFQVERIEQFITPTPLAP